MAGIMLIVNRTVSYGELADLVEARFAGTRFTRELWDQNALARQLEADPANTMIKYRKTFAEGRGVAWEIERRLNASRAMAMEDVREYLRGLQLPS